LPKKPTLSDPQHESWPADGLGRLLSSAGRPSAHQERLARFRRLLADVFERRLFREFLKEDNSEDQLLFWLAVEEFRGLSSSSKRIQEAERIYDTWIRAGSRYHLSVLRIEVRDRVERLVYSVQPPSDSFDEAQEVVVEQMASESFVRFLRSDLWRLRAGQK
jgi:regulator of G-protein signaling